MDFLLHHTLSASVARYPSKEALIHNDVSLTYAELGDQVARLAGALRQSGLQRSDRVAIYLDPTIAQVVSIYGTSQAGGVFVPINTLLVPDQVSHIARDCTVSALITTSAKLEMLKEILPEIASLRFVIVTDDGPVPSIAIPLVRWSQACAAAPAGKLRDICISKDLAAILYTSGSTGKPKGVMLSHANVIAGATIVSTYLGITDRERILAVLPFSFDAGLNQLTTSVQQGATIALIKFVFAREIVQALLNHSITALAGVPTVWNLLVQPNSGLTRQPLTNLRYITNTGGAMPQATLTLLRKALPTTKIFLMYGLTEAFRSTYLPPEELDRRPTSMGKAIPDTEIMVVHEDGRLCKPGEIGELVHRGPTVSMGYWGNKEATDRVLRPHPLLPPQMLDHEKVCYSGDLVKTDEDGFLYYVSRRDTQIKSSGYRISPTEVEEVLYGSGKVRLAAVIGVPDDLLGQAVKAFVVVNQENGFNPEDLLNYCAEKLPRYMVPKHVEVISEMPRTSSGKVDYPALRRREGL